MAMTSHDVVRALISGPLLFMLHTFAVKVFNHRPDALTSLSLPTGRLSVFIVDVRLVLESVDMNGDLSLPLHPTAWPEPCGTEISISPPSPKVEGLPRFLPPWAQARSAGPACPSSLGSPGSIVLVHTF